MKPKQKPFLQNLDLVTTILPFGCIALLCCLLCYSGRLCKYSGIYPFFLEMSLEVYYLLMGLGSCDLFSLYGISRFGSIKLGDMEKPSIPLFSGVP